MASVGKDPVDAGAPVGAQLGFLLAQLGRAATRKYGVALAPIGLNPRQTAALMRLQRDGAMGQQALGEAIDVDPSNLVALLNHLEGLGLATRRRDPQDRRRHVVEVTKRGIKKLTEIERAAAATEAEFFAALHPDERVRLYELLARVAEATELPERFEVAEAAHEHGSASQPQSGSRFGRQGPSAGERRG